MQLKCLNLKNIRSYGDNETTIPFTTGISLFEGDIGSGKSTILTAIEFALFGLGDLDSKHLLRHGEKRGDVELTFEAQGRDYTVRRSLIKSGRSIKHICDLESENSGLEEYSPSEIRIKILDILGFNEKPDPKSTSRIYRYAVYTPQEAMKEILNMTDNARMEILRRAFGIEQYRLVFDNVNTILISFWINPEIRLLEMKLGNLSGIKDTFTRILSDTKKLEETIRETEQQKQQLKTGIEIIEIEIERLTPQKDALLSLSGEISGIKGILENLNSQLTQLANTELTLTRDLEDIESIEKKFQELSRLYNEYQEKKTHLGKLEKSVQKRDELDRNIQILQSDIKREKALIEQKLEQLRDQYSKKTPIEASIESLNREQETLKPQKEHESKLNQNLKDLQKEMDILGPQKDKLTQLKGGIHPLKEQQNELKKQIGEIGKDADTFKKQLKAIQEKEKLIEDLSPIYSKYCQKKKDADVLEPCQSTFNDLGNKRNNLQNVIDNEKNKLKLNIDQLNKDKKEYQSVLQNITELEKAQRDLNKAREKIENEIKDLENCGKIIQELNAKKTKLAVKKQFAENEIKNLKDEWDAIDKLKVGAQCPRCKQVLTEKHVKNIGVEYQRDITTRENAMGRLSDQLKEIEGRLNKQNLQIISLQDPTGRLKKIDTRLAEIRADLKHAKDNREKLGKKVAMLSAAENSLNQNLFAVSEREQLIQIQKEIDQLTPKVKDYDSLKKSIKELEGRKIPSQHNTLTGEIAQKGSLLDQIATNEKKRIYSEEMRKQLEENLVVKNQTLENGKVVFDRIEDIEMERKKQISALKEVNEKVKRFDQIPVEIQGLKEQLQALEDIKPKMEKLDKLLIENQFALKEQKAIKEVNEQLRKLQPDIDLHTQLKERLDQLDADEIVSKHARYTTRIQQKPSCIQSIQENGKQKKETIDQIKEKDGEIANKIRLQKEGSAVIEMLNTLEKQKKDEGTTLGEIRENLAGLTSEKGNLEKDLEKIQNDIEDFHIKTEMKNELEETKRWLEDYFLPTIKNIEKHVLAAINQQFNDLFQKSFSMLVEAEDMRVMVTETFAPIIEQDGYEINVKSLSGGEKTAVALAYRLALNTLIKKQVPALKNSLLILDEPTDGFSSSQLHKLRDILKDTACDQIVMVSHENELEGFVDRIYHVTKDNGVSSVRG